MLHDVLFIPQLQCNLLSIILIRQQGNSILLKNGQVVVRKQYNNEVVLTGCEDGRLLKLNGTCALSNFFHILPRKVVYLLLCYGMQNLGIFFMKKFIL